MFNIGTNYPVQQRNMQFGSAIMSGIASYFSAKASQRQAQFEAEMAQIRSRMAEMGVRMSERQAQSILRAGSIQQAQQSMKAGQIKSSQKATMAARGIQAGVGSAAEVVASTDIMKEMDTATINAEAVRQAWAARMGGVNEGFRAVTESNRALVASAQAGAVSPMMQGFTTMLNASRPVADSWYRARVPKYQRDTFLGGMN
jgi:uncharacterized protein YneF (UPF0154 family)